MRLIKKPAAVYMRGGVAYDTAGCPTCGRQGVPLRKGTHQGHLFKHKMPGTRSFCVYHGDPADPPDYLRRFEPDGTQIAVNASDSPTGGPIDLDDATPAERAKQEARITLADWWIEAADHEIDMVVDKAIEYGATDLRDIGLALAEMAGGDLRNNESAATEIGIVFYVLGKVARLVAAVKEGRQPSLDTWLDIGIYARMAQRVHAVGSWPGV